MDELEGEKINIESTNRLLEILTNDMNELEEATYRLYAKCYFNGAVVCNIQIAIDHLMIMSKADFDESLYIFEREYDYHDFL